MNNNDYASKINNIMDKAKEDVRTQIDRAYQQGYADAKSELGQNAIDLAHEESDRAYQQGLEDAWEAARKIALMDTETSENITGYFGLFRIMENLTPMQAIEKIKEYEDKQKQDTIQVGDEVYLLDENHPRVVTNIFDDGGRMRAVQISENGKWVVDDVKKLYRTGRTFPQIAEVLKEMRGESE